MSVSLRRRACTRLCLLLQLQSAKWTPLIRLRFRGTARARSERYKAVGPPRESRWNVVGVPTRKVWSRLPKLKFFTKAESDTTTRAEHRRRRGGDDARTTSVTISAVASEGTASWTLRPLASPAWPARTAAHPRETMRVGRATRAIPRSGSPTWSLRRPCGPCTRPSRAAPRTCASPRGATAFTAGSRGTPMAPRTTAGRTTGTWRLRFKSSPSRTKSSRAARRLCEARATHRY